MRKHFTYEPIKDKPWKRRLNSLADLTPKPAISERTLTIAVSLMSAVFIAVVLVLFILS